MYYRKKRLQQIENSARSLQVMGEQSSVYIPLSSRPVKLPDYLSMDATSPWHVAAMQVVGLESFTISSRLRASAGERVGLAGLEDALNSTGKRRLAKFQMSIADPEVLSDKALDENVSAEKSGSIVSPRPSEETEELTSFDMDLFTRDYGGHTKRLGKKEHVFGRVEVERGDWTISDENEEQNPRGRLGYGPILQRYVTEGSSQKDLRWLVVRVKMIVYRTTLT